MSVQSLPSEALNRIVQENQPYLVHLMFILWSLKVACQWAEPSPVTEGVVGNTVEDELLAKLQRWRY